MSSLMIHLAKAPPVAEVATGHGWELRLGRWEDVLADVQADALISDPPYSERTHSGHNGAQRNDQANAQCLLYSYWTTDEVERFVASWSPRCRGWFVVLTDHVLFSSYETAFRAYGRYPFAPVPCVEPGMTVRLAGDGPSSWTVWGAVARPRTQEFSRWGTLPGAYVIGPGHRDRTYIGGKPLWLMRHLVKDYSRPGDLIVDPCAGLGTTLAAAALEDRGAIGCEVDPEVFEAAVERLKRLDESLGLLGATNAQAGRQVGLFCED